MFFESVKKKFVKLVFRIKYVVYKYKYKQLVDHHRVFNLIGTHCAI